MTLNSHWSLLHFEPPRPTSTELLDAATDSNVKRLLVHPVSLAFVWMLIDWHWRNKVELNLRLTTTKGPLGQLVAVFKHLQREWSVLTTNQPHWRHLNEKKDLQEDNFGYYSEWDDGELTKVSFKFLILKRNWHSLFTYSINIDPSQAFHFI